MSVDKNYCMKDGVNCEYLNYVGIDSVTCTKNKIILLKNLKECPLLTKEKKMGVDVKFCRNQNCRVFHWNNGRACCFLNDKNPIELSDLDSCPDKTASNKEQNTSDGGSNNFYKFPANVTDIDSLARYWKLSFAEGNILKSLAVNLGSRHDGTNPKREKKKALHYAIDRLIEHGISRDEIDEQVTKQLKKQF